MFMLIQAMTERLNFITDRKEGENGIITERAKSHIIGSLFLQRKEYTNFAARLMMRIFLCMVIATASMMLLLQKSRLKIQFMECTYSETK